MFRKKAALLLMVLMMAAGLAACRENVIYGTISHISSSEITVSTGSYREPELQEGDRTSEESAERRDALSAASDGFHPDGESATYHLSEEVDTNGLLEGDLIKLSLVANTVSSIETIQTTSSAGSSGAEAAESSAAYIVDHQEKTSVNQTFDSNKPDVSAVLVKNEGTLELREGELTKSGNTSGSEGSDVYGLNAVLLASGGSTVSIKNTTFHSGALGANAVFAMDKNTKISLSKFKIYTTEDNSRGLDASRGSTISASSGRISTKGSCCAPVAANQGSSTIKLRGTILKSAGKDSPCIYSAGTVTCTDVSGNSGDSPIAAIDGKGSLTLKDCFLQGAGDSGILLYQSTSGDTAEGKTAFKTTGSKLTTTSKGPMFYVTNTQASAVLRNTTLYFSSEILAKAAGDNARGWGTPGKNGGDFTLKGIHQTLKGDISGDALSTVSLILTKNSTLKGAVNRDGKAKAASVSLDETSFWSVSSDSHVTELTNKDFSCRNIVSNGHTVYYDPDRSANKWLAGKTIPLSGGGKLTPSGGTDAESAEKDAKKSSGSSGESWESVIQSDLSSGEASEAGRSDSGTLDGQGQSGASVEQSPRALTKRNGTHLKLQGTGQDLNGDITCTSIRTVFLSLTRGTTLTGAVNPDKAAKSVSLFLDKSSTWNVTADSFITKLSNEDASCRNIVSNGHTVYYDADCPANKWLAGKTIPLPGGGKLTPSP